MNKKLLWKNFNIGIELDIAGNFIYNGLKFFDEMESLYYEDYIFEFLYQIAVGFERLEKISLILLEDISNEEQEGFEKGLKTHNHTELFKRIKKFKTINLAKEHNEFIQILTNFYKQNRYGRYSLEKLDIYDEEKNKLVGFINKYSDVQIVNDFKTEITQNNIQIKKFIGRIVKKIVLSLYEIIKDESAKQNIYTAEIRIDSKASKIFLRKEFDFQNEAIFTKEILIYMLQNENGYTDYIKSIKALDFDEVLLPNYFKCLNNDLEKIKYFDELESLYEVIPDFKNRLNDLSIIDINSIDFDEFKNKENNMPVVSKFLGIIITMYWNEHNPPHFHAKYGEYKIIVHIKTGVIEGKFPKRALKMVMEWSEIHRDELLADWELCAKREMPEPISPLE